MKPALPHLDLGARCPVDVAIDLIGGKWKPMILYRIGAGTLRFGQLQRAIPEVTQRMLTLQLRELERDGLLTRKVFAEVPPKVEYTLTRAAIEILPVLEALGQWVVDNRQALAAVTEAENTAATLKQA
jgi:DNA-binding HxlR family transcriptional regulator